MVPKRPWEFCRHWARTRGWESVETAEDEHINELVAENQRLKARCQEARSLINGAVPVFKEDSEAYALWEVTAERWRKESDA